MVKNNIEIEQNIEETNKNEVEQKRKEQFKDKNQDFLSQTKLMDWETDFEQTIELSDSEVNNPEKILDFLKVLKQEFNLELNDPENSEFFKLKSNDDGKSKFDKILLEMYEKEIDRAYVRLYVYLYLLNRKVLTFNFENNLEYNFMLKDLYKYRHFELDGFTTINDIPGNVVQNSKNNRELNEEKVEDYLFKLKKFEIAHDGITKKMDFIASNEDLSDNKKRIKIDELENKVKSIENKIIDLSREIKGELNQNQRLEASVTDEVADFIVNFFSYSLKISNKEMKNKVKNQIKITDDRIKTSKTDIIKGVELSDLYIQDLTDYKWVKLEDSLHLIVSRIAPKSRFTQKEYESIAKRIVKLTKEKKRLNVVTFKHDCIFLQNGVIDLRYKDAKYENIPLSYKFYKNEDMTQRELMFDYATDYRCDVNYNDNVDYTFSDYNVDVTPDFIFGHLGRIGYETNDDTDKEQALKFKSEADARVNLLMQYFIKVLLPYNDFDALKGTLLYFFNAKNSGKSTFMKLNQSIIGKNDTSMLKQKDVTSKSEFGLINTVGKKLLVLDEFTDGKGAIDCENLKHLATKDPMEVNAKNKDYVRLEFDADIIIASNEQPRLSETTGAMERRLLAFELESGYERTVDTDKDKKELSFIKDDYVEDDDFQSACIKWALEHVDIHQPIPESIKESANAILSQEDDVQEFVIDTLQPEVETPQFFTANQLYAMYKLQNIAKGRKNKIRNKSNFIKAISKMHNRVRPIKAMNYFKLDNLNKYIYTESRLFYGLYKKLTNIHFRDEYTLGFQATIGERSKELKKIYQQYESLKHGNSSRSTIGRSNSTMYCVLPDNEIYQGHIDEKILKKIAKDEGKDILKTIFEQQESMEKLIQDTQSKNVPLFIRANISNDINSYTDDDFQSEAYTRTKFDEFVNY